MSSTGKGKDTRESEVKDQLKAAYLLQLRKRSFGKRELTQLLSTSDEACDAIIHRLVGSGFVVPLAKEGDAGFVLTPKGRGELVVVLAGGVYDVLHLGHLAALTEARALGDVLVVVVATDVTVETFKGRKPVFPEEDRRALVEALKPVDKAILGYEDVGMGYEQVMDEVKPDIIALGYDQESLARTVGEIIQRKKLNMRIVRLSKFERERYLSSSAIRQKLAEEL